MTWNKLLRDDVPEEYEVGTPEYEDYLRNNKPDDFIQYQDLKNKLTRSVSDLDSLQNPYNVVTDAEKKLNKADTDLHNAERGKASLESQKAELESDRTNNAFSANKDKYLELMAYWDMLESHWKSHKFTLAANKMRDKFLDGFKDGNSKAQQMSQEYFNEYIAKYGSRAA